MKPSRLLPLLSVPGTDEPVRPVVTHMAGDEPWAGWLEDQSGRMVGVIEEFRVAFVQFDPIEPEERQRRARGAPLAALTRTQTRIDPFDARIGWEGEAIVLNDHLKGLTGHDRASRIMFRSDALRMEILLHAHGWSGHADVFVDGKPTQTIDLFNRESAILRRFAIDNPARAARLIEIRPGAGINPESQARQVILEGIVEFGEELETPAYLPKPSRNRGGAFHPRFFELLDRLEDDAVVLDVGGGKRQLYDPRYLNLEYAAYEEPGILGDATALPFKSNSIDLVYTAAVLEHVCDPLAMGKEIHRVLKPGGIVLANSAFMQPVHSEGQHFFNLTPYGIDLVFADFSDREVWCQVDFGFTVKWMTDLLQVSGTIDQDRLNTFFAIAEEIGQAATPERGRYVASGVWLTGRK